MTQAFAALSLVLLTAGPAPDAPDAPGGSATALFSRAEPSIAGGAAALADGDVERALELFRKARADTPDQRAIVEFDVGQAMVAQALATATQAPAAAAAPGQEEHAQAPQLDKTLVDDAQAAFSRARGLARDARVKAEASLAGGNLAAFAGDVDGAIAQYRQALQDDPSNLRAKKNLRRALEAKKQQPPPPQDGEPQPNDDKNDKNDKKDEQNKDDKQEPKQGDQPPDDQKGDQKGDQQKPDPGKDEPKKGEGDDDKKEDGDEKKKEEAAPAPGSPEAKKAQKKEAARRLLDALRARERPLTPLEMRGAKPVRAKEGKDW